MQKRILFVGGPLHGRVLEEPAHDPEQSGRIPRAGHRPKDDEFDYVKKSVIFSIFGGPMREATVMEYIPREGERAVDAGRVITDMCLALGVS